MDNEHEVTTQVWQAPSVKFRFLAMALLLVGSAGLMYWIGLFTIRCNRAVEERQNAIMSLESLLSTLKDAETGQRGFLLVGDETYLEPYDAAVRKMRAVLQDLHNVAGTDRLPEAQRARLEQLIDAKFAELSRTLELRRKDGLSAAIDVVRQNDGKRIMNEVRRNVSTIEELEQSDLGRLKGLADASTRYRTLFFAVIVVLNLAFFVWNYIRLKREMYRSASTVAEKLHQQELHSVTLASIGDGVIVTDTSGMITFMNGVAERLTGWTAGEATGQPCTQVFNIINEESRKSVESPVDKVLRSGAIAGLANHTTLIRRDGVEFPIDDSGAPVRLLSGAIRGVVLVFRDFSEHKNVERSLLRALAEYQRIEVALRAAKEKLEAMNVAKDNFLATLSHELRTPLTPVLATLMAWEANENLSADSLSEVQMMRRNIELESRLIDDLLDLTRIVRNKLLMSMEVADVHRLIDLTVGMYQSEVHEKRLRLSLNLNAAKHHVYGDAARLQQVVWNILKNATKFTPEGGTIVVKTDNVDDQLRIKISDSGIGMSKETINRIFDPFEQASEAMVKQYGGLGLGLSISRALVEAHGGSVQADSDGPGSGSTFTVLLRVTDAPPVRQESPAVAETSDAEDRSPLLILLVEDHVDTANVLRRLLRRDGHEVSIAGSVAGALEFMRTTPVHVLVSDIGLPDGTGVDLIREIRRQFGPKVPAIALTGFGMEDDIAKCLEAGFDEHLTKPVNLQKLELAIRRVAEKPKEQQPTD